jgi:chorismate dehydratase
MVSPTIESGPVGGARAAVRTRIGAVRYLNTVPLIEGLGRLADVELRVAAPSALIGMLERDEVDLALASIVDCHRAAVPVAVVPVGMIGCDGETRTVRLLSRVPIDRIETLRADTESHTSVVLARLIVGWSRGGRAPAVEAWDASTPGPWPDAVVVIGDKVMDSRAQGYDHTIDLGEAWKARTGMPFVYAAWMCRADRAGSDAVRLGAAILDRQRRHNAMRSDWIVTRHASSHGWPVEDARVYLQDLLRYDVTDGHRGAVDRFFGEAAAMGVLEARGPVRWSDAIA